MFFCLIEVSDRCHTMTSSIQERLRRVKVAITIGSASMIPDTSVRRFFSAPRFTALCSSIVVLTSPTRSFLVDALSVSGSGREHSEMAVTNTIALSEALLFSLIQAYTAGSREEKGASLQVTSLRLLKCKAELLGLVVELHPTRIKNAMINEYLAGKSKTR